MLEIFRRFFFGMSSDVPAFKVRVVLFCFVLFCFVFARDFEFSIVVNEY